MLTNGGWLWGVTWSLANLAVAQAGPGWRCLPIDGAPVTVVAVAFLAGHDADPAAERGLARLTAECRLAAARAAVPDLRAATVTANGAAVVVTATVAAADAAAVPRFVTALLGPTTTVADDTLTLLVARAALRADDADQLWPGSMLVGMLQREVFPDSPYARGVDGDAVVLQQVTLARLRARLAATVAARGLVTGAVPADLLPALPPLPAGSLAPPPAVSPVRVMAPRSVVHPRADGPFVGFGYPVPAAVDPGVLAVALEVLRQRAATALPLRPQEQQGRAARVQWSWWDREPLVVLTRRGADGEAVDGPRRELSEWLATTLASPPTAAEVATATATFAAERLDPPWSPPVVAALAAAAETLPLRAGRWLVGDLRGPATADATAATVAAALQAVFGPGPAATAELLPTPVRRGRFAGWR